MKLKKYNIVLKNSYFFNYCKTFIHSSFIIYKVKDFSSFICFRTLPQLKDVRDYLTR